MMTCSMPAATASSTAYWMTGLSTSGSISLGCAFVAGRNRVPQPAAGKTALRTRIEPRMGRRSWASRVYAGNQAARTAVLGTAEACRVLERAPSLLSSAPTRARLRCVAAIWMRLPQVSSKTAVVTGPMRWLLREPDTELPHTPELRLDVVDAERRVRDAVLDQGRLERLGCRMLVRFEQELGPARDPVARRR